VVCLFEVCFVLQTSTVGHPSSPSKVYEYSIAARVWAARAKQESFRACLVSMHMPGKK